MQVTASRSIHSPRHPPGDRRPWSTGVAFGVTLAVSLVALAVPHVMSLLIGDPSKIAAGQWWRLATPVLVQPDGWGQLTFNLLGIAVVGAALERRIGWRSWTAVYLFGGICTILLTIHWHPLVTDGGSSAAVAALVAALSVLVALEHRQELQLLDWIARIYCVFFVCYLTGLALGGLWPGIIAGNASFVVVAAARRQLSPKVLAYATLILVAAAALIMTIELNDHGAGLVAGFVAVVVLLAGRRWIGKPRIGLTDAAR